MPDLKVKSRNSVFRYKNKDVDIQKVGKDLTVDALLTGRVAQHGDMIQVSADLTNVQDNTEIWGEHYERKASDILGLQQQMASDIAGKLRSKLSGDQKQQVSKQGTQNPEAYQLLVFREQRPRQSNLRLACSDVFRRQLTHDHKALPS